MRTVTIDQAAKDLKHIINQTLQGHDQTVIASDVGAVVLLEETEWSNIQETLRLLSDKKSLAALLKSHSIRDNGEKVDGVEPERAFYDL